MTKVKSKLQTNSNVLPAAEDGKVTALLDALAVVSRSRGIFLTPTKLIQDNLLDSDRITIPDLLVCAQRAGMKAKLVRIRAEDFGKLRKTLPAIVVLRTGAAMVLKSFDPNPQRPLVHLANPRDEEGGVMALDLVRFEEAWSGDLIIVKRNYDLVDEEQPFSFALIAGLVFRERRMTRDVGISAFFLGLFALAPIMYWRMLSDKVIYYSAMNTFVVLMATMGVIIMFEALFSFFRQFLLNVIVARVDARLNEYIYDRLLQLPIDFFERTQVGEIAHDMHEVYRIREFLTGQLFGTILDSIMLVFFLPVMIAFSPLMTAVVMGFCVLIVLWLLAMLPALRRAISRLISAQTVRGSFLYQTLAGMRTVKSLALETRHRNEWDHMSANVANRQMELGQLSAVVQGVVRPLERLAVTGSYSVGVYMAVTTKDPVYIGALFAFLMLSSRVVYPLMQMAQLIHQLDEVRAAVGLVGNLVNRPKEEVGSANGVRRPLEGHVQFSGLRFKYPGATNYALDGVNFEVPIGWTVGIVGRSGSGKTTVTRLLQRLHSDYDGLIKVDGIDVREYDLQHLRRSLGVVLQENFLFSGTIRENITAAKPHATFDEVVNACRLAGAEEFIERLARGYETYIYEGSPNLSGGQKQRLAIARALVVDPRILILDEATSALDPDSEAIVNENIRRIAAGRTVIVVSHRLSSLVKSDAILVLERGKVEAMDKHEVLLQSCDIYRGLWNQQNRHTAPAVRALARGPSRVS
jgi:ATP-binding cassette subfamily B protein